MASCTALALMQAAAAAVFFLKQKRHSNSTAGSLKSNVFLTQEKQSKKESVQVLFSKLLEKALWFFLVVHQQFLLGTSGSAGTGLIPESLANLHEQM